VILRRLNQGGLSFSVTPDLKNGSFIFRGQKIAACGSSYRMYTEPM